MRTQYDVVWNGTLEAEGKVPGLSRCTGASQISNIGLYDTDGLNELARRLPDMEESEERAVRKKKKTLESPLFTDRATGVYTKPVDKVRER